MISLPIDSHLSSIRECLKKNDVVFLRATPGAGKTTRIPPAMLSDFKKILVLEPRRIACVGSVSRICDETEFKFIQDIGYEVRFEQKVNATTRITFMTDGLFVRKFHTLDQYDLIILDEFHERSWATDLLLGLLREHLELEKSFKLLLMSATFDHTRITKYFESSELNSHFYDVQGTVFPLEIENISESQRLATDDRFFDALLSGCRKMLDRSIETSLIFLPGLREIRHAENLLKSKFPNVPVDQLHGQLHLEEQKKVLASREGPRFILTTNIAESSLTVEGVRGVLDSGLQRLSFFNPRSGLESLNLERISLFSAQQRAGRAARQGPGYCLRLWSQFDEPQFAMMTMPEVLRTDIRPILLLLSRQGIRNFTQFSWFDSPEPDQFKNALNNLVRHELILKNGELTPLGKKIQAGPLEIDEGLLFQKAEAAGFLHLGAHLASLLSEAPKKFFSSDPARQSDVLGLLDLPLTREQNKIYESLTQGHAQVEPWTSRDLSFLLLKTRFDQLCQRREPGSRKAKHFSGLGAELAPESSCMNSEFFIAFQAQDRSRDIFVRSAHGITKQEVLQEAQEFILHQDAVEIDLVKKQIFRKRQRYLGAFILDESKSKASLGENRDLILHQFSSLLFENHKSLPLEWLEFISKINWLKSSKWENDAKIPEFQSLLIFQEFAEYLLEGVQSFEEIFEKNWGNLFSIFLQNKFSFSITNLWKDFPDFYVLQDGNKKKIIYEGDTPYIEGRVQEFYGTQNHPSLLRSQLPMKVILLGPHYRPVQVTSDLPQFWKTSYQEIKKELKGQYPKHFWPEDPANEMPPMKKGPRR